MATENAEFVKQQKIYGMMQKILKEENPRYSQVSLSKLVSPMSTLEVLEEIGYQVQVLSSIQPTLRAALYTLVYGRIKDDVFDRLVGSFENLMERVSVSGDVVFVHLFTEKQHEGFVQLASKVEISEDGDAEETVSFECLYTDDPGWNSDSLGIARSSEELKVLTKKSMFKQDKCYLISVLSKEVSGERTERVRDYLVYIPLQYFTSFG